MNKRHMCHPAVRTLGGLGHGDTSDGALLVQRAAGRTREAVVTGAEGSSF